jgi:hypothetical protein
MRNKMLEKKEISASWFNTFLDLFGVIAGTFGSLAAVMLIVASLLGTRVTWEAVIPLVLFIVGVATAIGVTGAITLTSKKNNPRKDENHI